MNRDADSPVSADAAALLVAEMVCVTYPGRDGRGELKAVDEVSFTLNSGETLGVVGESGSGKTSLARTIVRLQQPSSGRILLEGRDIALIKGNDLAGYRRKVQMVFQDVSGALNPRHRVRRVLGEVLKVHDPETAPRNRRERVIELLEQVGLSVDVADSYAHELSGGQRQRVGLARALAVKPDIIVADEPVSALDVSVQAQILNLMRGLQRELGISYLFIAHDLAVVKQICDRVMVMHNGKVVEEGVAGQVLGHPRDDYTKSLLDAVPDVERGLERRLEVDQ